MEYKDKPTLYPLSRWRSTARYKRRASLKFFFYLCVCLGCILTLRSFMQPRAVGEKMLFDQSKNRISLPLLKQSLRTTMPSHFRRRNKNMLFISSSIEIADELGNLACELASMRQASAHFLLVGPSETTLEFFQAVNKFDTQSCGDFFMHDGRMSNAAWAAAPNIEQAAYAAIGDAVLHLAPQAVVYLHEEPLWFCTAVQHETKVRGITNIVLPRYGLPSLQWMSRLDAASLQAWNTPQIDIMVLGGKHSGALKRLLESIQNADYFGSNHPRVILDLDPTIDSFTMEFVRNWRWHSQTILRHRIDDKVDSETKVVESWYPGTDSDSFLLMLDCSAELSPFYYHWLKYSLLHYAYSGIHYRDPSLMGISLDAPFLHINQSAARQLTEKNPIVLQMPSTRSVLYFPHHWREIHDFVAHRIRQKNGFSMRDLPLDPSLPLTWLGYVIELVRIRAYVILYPTFDSSFSTLHNEHKSNRSAAGEEQTIMDRNTMLSELPELQLPQYTDLIPHNIRGEPTSWEAIIQDAQQYHEFMSSCTSADPQRSQKMWQVDDIFCDPVP